MEPIIFVDCETTGLDPERHEVWEIALIEADGTEHEWRVQPEVRHADEGALRITHFYERIHAAGFREETIEEGYPRRSTTVKRANFWSRQTRRTIAVEVATLTANKHLVGAVPWFDARFITNFLGGENLVPAWHYHMVDVETLAAGRLGIRPPWGLADLARRLGIDPEQEVFAKHTATGDARLARAVYLAALDPLDR